MAILMECPKCHRKQATKTKVCLTADCKENLDRAKKAGNKVRYWVTYRLPNGKQRKEFSGYSYSDASAADGKRRSEKREGRILDRVPGEKMTFAELSRWYLARPNVQRLASFKRIGGCLKAFNQVFGEMPVNKIQPADLESYQARREDEELAPATIDMEITIAKTMVNRAFDNDMIDVLPLKAFRKTKKRLRLGNNARSRILSVDEYVSMMENSTPHIRLAVAIAYHMGMRSGEIKQLSWDHIKDELVYFAAEETKENRGKRIPVSSYVKSIIESMAKAEGCKTVLSYRGRPVKDFKEGIRASCQRAGIGFGRDVPGGFIFHDLRRTAKTNMMRAGVSKAIRDAILGHAPQGMDRHYMKPDGSDLIDGMRRYDEWFADKVGNKWATVFRLPPVF